MQNEKSARDKLKRAQKERERDRETLHECVTVLDRYLSLWGESGALPFQQVTRLTPASR